MSSESWDMKHTIMTFSMITVKPTSRLICLRKSGGGYAGEPSIFDGMTSDDMILAFFPCTRFEDQISLSFRGESYQMKNYTDTQKLEYAMRLHKELSENYEVITMLTLLCIKRNIRLVIENPRGSMHYLNRYWPIKPEVIDTNRRKRGDYQKKPTQYWFVGFKPHYQMIMEAIDEVPLRINKKITSVAGRKREVIRSEIHPQYANRFIREFLIDGS